MRKLFKCVRNVDAMSVGYFVDTDFIHCMGQFIYSTHLQLYNMIVLANGLIFFFVLCHVFHKGPVAIVHC